MPMLMTKVQPVARDFQLLLDDVKPPQGVSQAIAEFARVEIEDAKTINRQALGYDPALTIYVDGQKNAALESVKNVIVGDFALVDALLIWIDAQLRTHSPVRTGLYKKSHALFADGRLIDIVQAPVPVADEYIFVNLVPYARKIERGLSPQAPEGVYQVVAHLAQSQFGGIGRVTFTYRTAIGEAIIGGKAGDRSELRNPAILVRGRV